MPKLAIDFVALPRLPGAMTTHPDKDGNEEQEIIRRLFFLMTTLCEDGAELAASGQASQLQVSTAADLANRLHSTGRALMIIADAARALAERRG